MQIKHLLIGAVLISVATGVVAFINQDNSLTDTDVSGRYIFRNEKNTKSVTINLRPDGLTQVSEKHETDGTDFRASGNWELTDDIVLLKLTNVDEAEADPLLLGRIEFTDRFPALLNLGLEGNVLGVDNMFVRLTEGQQNGTIERLNAELLEQGYTYLDDQPNKRVYDFATSQGVLEFKKDHGIQENDYIGLQGWQLLFNTQ